MMRNLSLVAFVIAAAAVGCFPQSAASRQNLGPAPIVDTEAPSPQLAQQRRLYQQNRPEAPRQYQVFPKPPRNNSFGEFDENMYYGLDQQPALPRLPSDVYAMSAPAPAPAYPMPPATMFASTPTAPAGGATVYAAADGKPAGVAANNGFVPLEQLVYGGDYPDLDQPDAYRLMPKDVISVTVKDHPEFSGKAEIQPDGTIRVPNAPDLIRIRGLTPDEAADEIRRTLAVYVRGECLVRVQTNRARGGYYFVFGDVLQPGRFPMGLEPVKLSDAVLAANWEANPARLDADGDELGPSFPAASPRGKFIAPPSADLAHVMLITPHRSQPIRTSHDIRSAMLGITANDPVVKPGQIVVVPSLRAERNRHLGLPLPGQGFGGAGSPARLPEAFPDNGPADYQPMGVPAISAVEENMARSFETNINEPETLPALESYSGHEIIVGDASLARREIGREVVVETREVAPATARRGWFWQRRSREACVDGEGTVIEQASPEQGNWKKGF